MPGMQNLRRSDRFDTKKQVWVLVRASKVPAPLTAVTSFYKKALQTEGLSVSQIDEPPDQEGTKRATLKGRQGSTKVQIAIRQPAGSFETTARVIWQTPG